MRLIVASMTTVERRRTSRLAAYVLACASAFGVWTGCAPDPAELLEATITMEAEESPIGSPALLRFTLTNHSDTTLQVLKWHTPLEGVLGKIFRVTREGKGVVYLGIMARRADPLASSYVTLSAGESLSNVVDLAKDYDLDAEGEYRVALDTQLHDVRLKSAPRPLAEHTGISLTTEAITFRRTPGTIGPKTETREVLPEPGPDITTIDCSALDTRLTIQANNSAISWSKLGYDYLHNCGEKDPAGIYKHWFGEFKLGRFRTVEANMSEISDALGDDKNVVFQCDGPRCKPKWYAYVIPSSTKHTIYLCDEFWKTTAAERSVTVVHEMSHFNNVAGAKDTALGWAVCQELAETDPDSAITNAENYAYFAYVQGSGTSCQSDDQPAVVE